MRTGRQHARTTATLSSFTRSSIPQKQSEVAHSSPATLGVDHWERVERA